MPRRVNGTAVFRHHSSFMLSQKRSITAIDPCSATAPKRGPGRPPKSVTVTVGGPGGGGMPQGGPGGTGLTAVAVLILLMTVRLGRNYRDTFGELVELKARAQRRKAEHQQRFHQKTNTLPLAVTNSGVLPATNSAEKD